MSTQALSHALQQWLENGVLLGAAAAFSLAIFQVMPSSGASARYVAFWIVLPAVWLVAMSFTRVVREFILDRYDDLGTFPRRVVAGGAIGAAFILYAGIITSNIPDSRPARHSEPVASLALVP